MRDDPDPDTPTTDPEHPGDEAEDEARRSEGRNRMLSMWREAVRCVTEAAAREAAHNDPPPPEPAPDTDLEGYGPPDDSPAEPWPQPRVVAGPRN